MGEGCCVSAPFFFPLQPYLPPPPPPKTNPHSLLALQLQLLPPVLGQEHGVPGLDRGGHQVGVDAGVAPGADGQDFAFSQLCVCVCVGMVRLVCGTERTSWRSREGTAASRIHTLPGA